MSNVWFAIQRSLFKSKKLYTLHLHLIKKIIKPTVLDACESWGDSGKTSKIKVDHSHVSLCKQVSGIRKTTST